MIRELVARIEKIKWDGGFDDRIFEEINLALKLTDREIEDIDINAARERARLTIDLELFAHLKRRYPHLFDQ